MKDILGTCQYEMILACSIYPKFLGNIILLCAMIEQDAHVHMEDHFRNLKGFRFRCMSCNICFCSHTLWLYVYVPL